MFNPQLYIIKEKQREKLYNEVWTEPLDTVAARYEVSDTTLRKHCKKLDIPLPERGYWAKLKSGQNVVKTRLPKVSKEVSKYVSEYIIKFREDLEEMTDDELLSGEEFNLLTDDTITYIKERCNIIKVPGKLINSCIEILNHKEEIENRKKKDRESKSSIQRIPYNNNFKIKINYDENKSVIPINVSKENINRAYRIIDTLIKVLPDFEASISVGDYARIWPNPPVDKAVINVIKVSFSISMCEKSDSKNNNILGSVTTNG